MNNAGLSVGAFIRGPLVHTPQGIVVLAFSVLYFVIAAMLAFGFIAPPSPWLPANLLGLCLTWPFILVLLFIRSDFPVFSPSWGSAAWLGVCAVAPGAFTLWRA